MSAGQPQKLFGTTNELAKERNRAAAERTLNSWVGSCLGLIGAGFAVDEITTSLRQDLPDANPVMTEQLAHLIGMTFIGVGLFLLTLALIQHRLSITTIKRKDYVQLSITTLNRVVLAAILILGFIGLFVIVF